MPKINDLNLKKIAILHVNNDFGIPLADAFSQEFKNLGGVITTEESYNQDA